MVSYVSTPIPDNICPFNSLRRPSDRRNLNEIVDLAAFAQVPLEYSDICGLLGEALCITRFLDLDDPGAGIRGPSVGRQQIIGCARVFSHP
jgi:hypothetical protein